MKRLLLIAALSWCITAAAQTSTVTYSEHVAPIIYTHCTQCHRTGEIAPFPLTNYTEVQSNAYLIGHTTAIHYMPPWKADPSYQRYQKENYLSAAEIQTIADWIAGGTPQGNPALEPPLPVYPTGSQVGHPDTVIAFARTYTHTGNNTDEYRYFSIPTGLTQDRDLIGLEVRPGNNKIVHHALFWEDTTGASHAADTATAAYGYAGNLSTIFSEIDNQLPSYVPGQKPTVLNNGMAYRLHKNSWLKGQFHYAPTATDENDSSSFNLFFAQTPANRYVKSHVMVPLPGVLINGQQFYIPANQVKEFHGTYTMPEDASMLSTMPHMHLLGTHWTVYAVKPNGDTVHLIKINSWDFNWQGNFDFKNLIHLPQGTVIHALAGYDNTTNNVNNPHSPPIAVSWGENTTDEMYYLPLLWVSYRQGDETLSLDSTATGINDPRFYQVSDKLYPVAPNPASGKVKIGFTLGNSGMINLKLYDLNGREVSTLASNQYYMQGLYNKDLDLTALAGGEYILMLTAHDKKYEQRIVVAK